MASMSQITDGLNISNLMENIKDDPTGFKDFFIVESGDISFEKIESLFKANFSIRGSNNYKIEIDVYQYFLDMIEEMCFSSKYFEFQVYSSFLSLNLNHLILRVYM